MKRVIFRFLQTFGQNFISCWHRQWRRLHEEKVWWKMRVKSRSVIRKVRHLHCVIMASISQATDEWNFIKILLRMTFDRHF